MLPVLRTMGYTIAVGSAHPFDAQIRSTAHNAFFLRRSVAPGDVVILHSRGYNLPLFHAFLAWARARGLRVVSLGELAELSAN